MCSPMRQPRLVIAIMAHSRLPPATMIRTSLLPITTRTTSSTAAVRPACRRGLSTPTIFGSMYGTLFAGAYCITPESIILHAGSLVFNGAFVTLLSAMYHGATYIIHPRFEPDTFIETIARERV